MAVQDAQSFTPVGLHVLFVLGMLDKPRVLQ